MSDLTIIPWLRKALALAILGALLLTLWLVTVEPALSFFQRKSDAIQRSAATLARLEALAQSVPATNTELSWRRSQRDVKKLFDGQTPDIAVAHMQHELQKIIRDHGGRIVSTDTGEAGKSGSLTRIALRMRIASTVEQLSQMLEAVHTSPWLIRLDDISIAAPQRQTIDDPPVLEIRWIGYGYYGGSEQ